MDVFRQSGAKVIWLKNPRPLNQYVRFQTEFSAKGSEKVLFYICTDTKYELYINGHLAGFGQYEDFPQEKIYDTYDVSEYIIEGNNLVSVLAYSQGENSFQHMSGIPMVVFAAKAGEEVLLTSGEHVRCSEVPEVLNGETERITPQRSFNFAFDLRQDDGWRQKKVCDAWERACVCDDTAISYSARPNKNLVLGDVCCGTVLTQGVFIPTEGDNVSQIMQYAGLAYRDQETVMKEENGVLEILSDDVFWISDLGKETVGYITLELEAEEGAVLDIACGEHLADMRVRSFVGGRNFAFRCNCRAGRQSIRFYVRRLAGRYLEFFAHKGIKKVFSAGFHTVTYPLEFVGDFHMNDRLFNRIYQVSADTLSLCMHEHYEDCPQREQALYGMDSRNQMLTGYYVFGETVMPRSSLELLAKSQMEDGLLAICAPASYERTIPSFSLAWILALWEYVLFSGDLTFAKEMQGVAKKALCFFTALKKDGLVLRPQGEAYWNFYEWIDGMDNLENDPDILADAPLNSFCMMALCAYEELCTFLQDTAEAAWAKAEYQEIAAVFHQTFYCAEKGVYQSYVGKNLVPSFSQLTQALALLAGCVPDNMQKDIRAALLSKEFGATTLSYLAFKYDALMQDAKTYGDYVLDDIEEQWGYMLYNGATSFWETILGEADFDRAGSLCHGWSAVPIYIFWRYVLGIYPGSVGYGEIVPNPCCGEGIHIEAELKTPDGVYKVTKKAGQVTVEQ